MTKRIFCTLVKEHYVPKMKKNGIPCKDRWTMTGDSTTEITEDHYNNCVDATSFFENLGGKEKLTKSYTPAGYVVIEIRSTSPDRDKRTVRKFINFR